MNAQKLIGLVGIILAALTAEFNDGVTTAALQDIQGGRQGLAPNLEFSHQTLSAQKLCSTRSSQQHRHVLLQTQ